MQCVWYLDFHLRQKSEATGGPQEMHLNRTADGTE